MAGYAKNLADGTVEVLAVGEASQVDAFVRWLWQGSSASQVTRVDATDVGLTQLGEIPGVFVTR